jgi:putative restriction endonuclease
MNNSPQNRRWSRIELFLAMHLYCRIPFGRQHANAPEIIELAGILQRTPSSVAMKLCNLTSLDPEEAKRGVRGLSGASELDRQVFKEFLDDWEASSAESESLWEQLVVERKPLALLGQARIAKEPTPEYVGALETQRTVTVRLAQRFFRRTVLASYSSRCCITGNPVPELLEAAHILPWQLSPENRTNPRNGLCLSRIHHTALDKGLIALDEKLRVVISKRLRDYLPNDAVQTNFVAFEGYKISLPEKFLPDEVFLERHRQQVFMR